MTIREYLDLIYPETLRVLTEDGGYTGNTSERPDLIGEAIALVIDRVFVAGTAESDITSETVKSYVALLAARDLVSAAIDYYAVRTARQDRIASPPRGDGIAEGNSRDNYDVVTVLSEQILPTITARLQREASGFWSKAQELGLVWVAAVNVRGPRGTRGGLPGFVTPDPRCYPPTRRKHVTGAFGSAGSWYRERGPC